MIFFSYDTQGTLKFTGKLIGSFSANVFLRKFFLKTIR